MVSLGKAPPFNMAADWLVKSATKEACPRGWVAASLYHLAP